MNEVSVEQLVSIIGEQAIEIRVLRNELNRLKQEQSSKEVK